MVKWLSCSISSAVCRGFDPPVYKTIKLVCIASPLGMQHEGERTKTGWLGIRIICRMELRRPADCCLSELAL